MNFLSTGLIVVLLVLLFILSPMITLWSVNTLSEQAHFGWYIPHNLLTYLAVYGIGLNRMSYKAKSEK